MYNNGQTKTYYKFGDSIYRVIILEIVINK